MVVRSMPTRLAAFALLPRRENACRKALFFGCRISSKGDLPLAVGRTVGLTLGTARTAGDNSARLEHESVQGDASWVDNYVSCTSQARNHNPRVGGSSPPPGTRVSVRLAERRTDGRARG